MGVYISFILIGITIILVTISFIKSRKKTIDALKKAGKKLIMILPVLIIVLILVSIVLYFIPASIISEYLSNGNKYISLLIASLFGSITVMPGFIAFPLSGVLKENNVPLMVIAGFTATMMMVGILSFPVERKYFGTGVAIARNVISFIISIIFALVIGIVFREVF